EHRIRDRNVTGVQTCALPIYTQRHLVKDGKQLCFRTEIEYFRRTACNFYACHTEYSEPDDADCSRYNQECHDEFTHGTASGNTGDEDADERTPAQPPCPVVDGPRLQPVIFLLIQRCCIQCVRNKCIEVIPCCCWQHIQYQHRRPEYQDTDEQYRCQNHICITQVFDAFAEAAPGAGKKQ